MSDPDVSIDASGVKSSRPKAQRVQGLAPSDPWLTLIPFFILTPLYFYSWTSNQSEEVCIATKVLPVYSLVFAAFSLGRSPAYPNGFLGLSPYSVRILIGLIFSSFGDILLEQSSFGNKEAFRYGLNSFFIAHIFFVAAFWINAHKLPVAKALVVYGAATAIYMLFRTGVPPSLAVPVLAYVLMLGTMAVCALSRFDSPNSSDRSQFSAAVGAIVFMVSDSLIGLNKFYTPIPHAKYYVMITYYAAQLLITISCHQAQYPPATKTHVQ